MKNLAVMLLLVWVALLCWLGLSLPPTGQPPAFAEPAPEVAPSAAAAPLAAAQAALGRLAMIDSGTALPSPLLVLAAPLPPPAAIPSTDAPIVAGDDPAAVYVPPPRTLSALFAGGDVRRAVVDGQYVQAGSRLEDGGRIVEIGDDSVLIADRNGRQRLQLARGLGAGSNAWPARSR